MYAPTHNTKSTHALPAMYIHDNIRIAQSETLNTNDHLSLKRVASITTTAKRNFTKNSLSEKFQAMHVVYTLRTYSDTMHEKCYNSAYNRLIARALIVQLAHAHACTVGPNIFGRQNTC